MGEFHLRCIFYFFIFVLFFAVCLVFNSCLLDLFTLLFLQLLGQVVWDRIIDRDPVKILILRHFEHLSQVAGFKTRVEEAVVRSKPFKLDVALSCEFFHRAGILSHLKDGFLTIILVLLLRFVKPGLQIVNQRELFHDF